MLDVEGFAVIQTQSAMRDSSWILQSKSANFKPRALQNPSVTAKNAPPERFLNAASNPANILFPHAGFFLIFASHKR